MSKNNEIHLTEYKCSQCNKTYASQSSLCNHNKKFHINLGLKKSEIAINGSETGQKKSENSYQKSQTGLIKSDIYDEVITDTKNYNCRSCNKIYYNKQSRWSHEKICKNKINLLEENIKLKQENEQLKKNNQLVPVNSNINNSTNNQTNNGNILKNSGTINNNLNNTVNNNNTVTINKIGTEPYKIKTKDIKMIANDGMNGPITCARKLNFSKNSPENHSYCITSIESDYCKAINHETQQPEIVPKKEIVDQVFESAYKFIESIAAQIKEDYRLRDKLSKHEIKEIERIVANKNKYYEKKNRKIFYNSVNSMGYNYRELVLSTWKLLKPIEENLIDGTESSDSDNEIKEITEFPDVNEESDSDSDDEMTIFDLIKK